MSLPTLLVSGALSCRGAVVPKKPVEHIIEWISLRLKEHGNHQPGIKNRVLIINASTGSGKSTVLPVALVRLFRGPNVLSKYDGPGVICTQPRVLTAMALASDVSITKSPWNKDMILGETVGYVTGPSFVGMHAKLLFATVGVLIVQLKNYTDAEIINKYKVIVIDEAHERSIDLDLLLIMLRNFYLRNKDNEDLPFLIFSSATMDINLYKTYFGLEDDNVFTVEGRAYPITEHWPEIIEDNYLEWAVATVEKIIISDPIIEGDHKNDILIFIPGAQESTMLSELLNTYAKSNPDHKLLIININSEVVNKQLDDYRLLFAEHNNSFNRRVIISTIVAETGLTINTLKHVIDCGWARVQETYFPWGASGLITRPAAKSRIKQRKGRVGRLFPGHFYPLYSKSVYESLPNDQFPDITSNGMSTIFLQVIKLQQKHILDIAGPDDNPVAEYKIEDSGLMTPPNIFVFLSTQLTAFTCGFISNNTVLPVKTASTDGQQYFGYGLTGLGLVASAIDRIPLELVKLILTGHIYNTSLTDLSLISAMCVGTSADILFNRGRTKKGDDPAKMAALIKAAPVWLIKSSGQTDDVMLFRYIRKYLSDEFIEDLLICEMIIEEMEVTDIKDMTKKCEELKLNFTGIVGLYKMRDEIMDAVIMAGLNPFRYSKNSLYQCAEDEFIVQLTNIKKCIYEGFKTNLMSMDRVETDYVIYRTIWDTEIALHKFSFPVPYKHPKYFVTNSITITPNTTRETPIQPLIYRYDVSRKSICDGFFNPDIHILEAKIVQ